MAKIGTLTLDLVADASKWSAGLDAAQEKMGQLRSKVNEFGSDVAKGIAAGAVAGAAALGVMIKASTDAAREIDAFTKSTNISASALQQWDFAGATVGIDSMGDVFKDVSDRVGEFITTGAGPMNDWFQTIGKQAGLTAADFANLSGPQALQKFVTVSEQAGATTDQLSHILQNISSNSASLLPLLRNNGEGMAKMAAEADALGLVLSDKEVFQLKGLGDSITKGTKLFGALTQHISAQLAPVLDGVLKLFTGWTKEMGGAKTMSETLVNGLVNGVAFIANGIDGVMRIGNAAWAAMKAGVLAVESVLLTVYNFIVGNFLGALGRVATVAASFGVPGAQAAADFVNGFTQGISTLTSVVQAQATAAAQAAGTAFSAIAATPLAGDQFKGTVAGAQAASDADFAAQQDQGNKKDPAIEQKKTQIDGLDKLIDDAHKKAQADEKANQDAINKISKENFEKRTAAAGKALSDLSTLMNSHSRKAFEVGKAAAIAQTVIDTYLGAQKAFSSLADIPIVGPALGIAAAAAAIASGMARVQAINSTEFGGGSAGVSNTEAVNSAATPTGGAGASAPTTNVYLRGLDPDKLYSGEQILGLVNNELKNGGKLLIGAAA